MRHSIVRWLYLDDEVAHDSAVVGVHARTECVEDAGYPHLHLGLALVRIPVAVEKRRLG